ncbi:MAG: DUF2490 domain-containing protein [Erythrobacter sp.]|nr:DUF2490 domain-containing protein [Erythrobacter sp.]
MLRTTALWLIPALLAGSAAPALAAEEDTQLWLTGTARLPLADDVDGTVDVIQRWRQGDEQLVARASLDLAVSDVVDLGGGLTMSDGSGRQEWRPHQQVNLAQGWLSWRTRLEERFFEGADRPQLRLRNRAQVTVPVARSTLLIANGELLYVLQYETAGRGDRLDSWRANLAVQQRVAPHLDLLVGYLAIDSLRPAAPDRLSHAAQLGFVWHP